MGIIDEYLYYQNKYSKKYNNGKTVVFMQVGSFHEAYATDTEGYNLKELSELLNIVCTKKDKSKKEVSVNNPYLLGVPSISFEKHLKTLINNDYVVPVVEQTTPPPNPTRELVGIYSKGTYVNETTNPDSNNIVCLYLEDEVQKNGTCLICTGMSSIDLTTGESIVHESLSTIDDEKLACDEVVRFINNQSPKEILVYRKTKKDMGIEKSKLLSYLELDEKNYFYYDRLDKKWDKLNYQNELLKKVYTNTGIYESAIEYLDLEKKPYAVKSFVLLIDYAYQHSEQIIEKLYKPEIFKESDCLVLGNNAIFQLNVISNNSLEFNNSKFKSLFDVINRTSTSMGRRYLKKCLITPLIDKKELEMRYNIIDTLRKDNMYKEIDRYLSEVIDIERMHRKMMIRRLHPHEFYSLMTSLNAVENLIKFMKKDNLLKKILPENKIIKKLSEFIKLYEKSYEQDVLQKHNLGSIEENIFKRGLYKEIDKIQDEITLSDDFMENICEILSAYVKDKGKAKKDDDGKIKMKLNSNRIDGHYISITKLRADSLRKNIPKSVKINDTFSLDTTKLVFKELAKGNTKISFPELNKKSDKLVELKYEIMNLTESEYVKQLGIYQEKYGYALRRIISLVSTVDYLKSSAEVSVLYNYCRPTIENGDKSFIDAKDLRHPIIERINTSSEYIPHSLSLGKNGLDGMLIFGINSAGKSVLMKAVGLSVILAQAGMFVPATNFTFSPYKSLFARITGNDNIFKGLSSFALEMTELKAILKRTGESTLVIGDEVCRGTEYISGNSIVAATIIKLSESKSSFMFATHLHDIPEMEEIKELKNVKPFHLTVEYDKKTDSLVFDRILKPGPGNSVYGITIAKYIIDNDDFIKVAEKIKNKITGKPEEFMSSKKSKYNADLFMDSCSVCKKKFDNTDMVSFLDTHHINFQKDCENGFVKKKPHIKMNSKLNLAPLCKACHIGVHNDKIIIEGYKKTSKGIILKYHEKNNSA
jgi:DNA mismatch repair protein MutS